jgi:hypothetical protein
VPNIFFSVRLNAKGYFLPFCSTKSVPIIYPIFPDEKIVLFHLFIGKIQLSPIFAKKNIIVFTLPENEAD